MCLLVFWTQTLTWGCARIAPSLGGVPRPYSPVEWKGLGYSVALLSTSGRCVASVHRGQSSLVVITGYIYLERSAYYDAWPD